MRSSIGSPIKSPVAKSISSGSLLPWRNSVVTPGTDAGKIIIAASNNYNINSAGSFVAWAKIPATGGTRVWLEVCTSVNDRCGMYTSANNLVVTAVKGGSIKLNSTTGFIFDGNWHQCASTWDINGCTVYVDGVLVATFAGDQTLSLSNPQIVYSGALSTTGFPCGGNFGQLALFSTKLTANQISGMYKANQIPSSCVGRWDFSKGAGTTVSPIFGPTSATLGTGDTWSSDAPKAIKLANNVKLIGI